MQPSARRGKRACCVTKVEFSRAAERDLIDIYLHGIERFGPAQAERYLNAINAKVEMAASHPDFGANYGAIQSGLRRYQAVSHAIYFQPTPSGILVLRVLHGRMDPGRHLG